MTDVFFFNDTATTEIYTLSLHDALPICIYLEWLPSPCIRFDIPDVPDGVYPESGGVSLRLDDGTVIDRAFLDRKSTRLNSSHSQISYAVFCLKKKKDVRTRLTTLTYTTV